MTPRDNAAVKSFNDRFRQEYVNDKCFMSMEDVRCKIEVWRILYNQSRSHSVLSR
ncbi:transposase [Pantoea sp. JGM49]|nr:transposase [Pantoea sp. JGM49]